ncbi:ABC transporter permease [Actinomadura spongiicola]|uniref:ABC transporter permease n=1 Tax=Actinomadura spongiicola TaxID=2303421 RepID=A0A372G6F7_9ACTN|nr:ABC transporter permease [Actinomadura spongiicola]RFS80965.1 ABC transporter permease [Actinomadura spongiicola]
MLSLARRAGQALATALLASLVVWALLPFAPGDPAARYLEARHVTAPTAEQLAQARADLGLDRSPPEQYARWLGGVVRGDLGESARSGVPVTRVITERVPATLRLTVATVLLALVVSVPLALAGAAFPGRWPDAVGRAVALLGAASPSFVVGLLLIEFVVVRWGVGSVVSTGGWSQVWFPALALALYPIARWSRLLRAGLLEALRSDHVTVATARGASRARVLLVHALPNAAVPSITVLAMTIGFLLGGVAIVENVFSWPGLGREIVLAVTARDLPVVQGFALVMAVVWVAVSLLADVVTALVDPRLRTGSRG